MTILHDIQQEFLSKSVTRQNKILWEYIHYVTDYPEDHDEGCYPASFWEWYQNDYPELTEVKKQYGTTLRN